VIYDHPAIVLAAGVVSPVSLHRSSTTLPGSRKGEARGFWEQGTGFGEEPAKAGRPAEISRKVSKDVEGELVEMDGEDGHVHLLATYTPTSVDCEACE